MRRQLAPDSRGVGALLVGLVAMMAISTDLYLPSLPSIARDFGVDVAAAQLTLSAFMLGIAAGQVVVGPLSDRFGRRPVLVAASACYALASVACALAPGIDALVASRVVQALGACAGGVVGRAVVRDVHGREGAARVLALIGSAMAIMPRMKCTEDSGVWSCGTNLPRSASLWPKSGGVPSRRSAMISGTNTTLRVASTMPAR